MKKLIKVLKFISAVLFTTVIAFATNITGKITVKGAPLAGAVVTANLIGAKGPTAVSVTRTGANGEYSLQGLANGNYVFLVDMNSRRVYQGKVTLKGPALVKNISLQ